VYPGSRTPVNCTTTHLGEAEGADLVGLFVAVLLPSELVNDEVRGLPAYTALRLRVVDEVRDRRRINPYSTLISIGGQPEVMA
jgi:hypothetical protein